MIYLRWVARLWAAGLVLFWGAFFVEHVSEWLIRAERWAPLSVLIVLAAHFSLLVGLIVGWHRELIGGVIVMISASLFLPGRTKEDVASTLMLVTIIPAILWLILGGYEVGRLEPAGSPGEANSPKKGGNHVG